MRQAFRRAPVDDPRAVLGHWLDTSQPGRIESQLAPLGSSEAFHLLRELALDHERRVRLAGPVMAVATVLGGIGGVLLLAGNVFGLLPVALAVWGGIASASARRRLGKLLIATVSVMERMDDPDLLGPLLTLLVRIRAFASNWQEARAMEGAVRAACAACVRLIEASGGSAWLDGDERAALASLIADAGHEHLLTVRPALFGDGFLVAALLLGGDLKLKEAAPSVFELPRWSASPQVQEAAREFLRANGLPRPVGRS